MKKYQVVFISTPAFGNLVPTVEFAQHLTNRHPQFSATILLMNIRQRPLLNAYTQACSSSSTLNFVNLPTVDPPAPDQCQSPFAHLCFFIRQHKQHVKHAIESLMESDSATVAGLFIDMFCTDMIDVANELGLNSYLFMASPASYLGFIYHLPALEAQLGAELTQPGTKLKVPSFCNLLPSEVLPSVALERELDGYFWYLNHARRYKEVKGIIVNTSKELEPFAVNSVCSSGENEMPPVYPIGPVLDTVGAVQWHPDRDQNVRIIKWLDDQPESSVVFLCFGSMGSLSVPQLREIAVGLERAGVRFVWSIREPPKDELGLPDDCTNVEEILPDGFQDRMAGVGLVCGWVSQATILAHPAIGGFVSHCGWNSILESVSSGVPIATFPLYAEQQMNAFLLVKELELAVQIRLDYREGGSDLVLADEIEQAVKRLKDDDEVRRKFKDLSNKSRMAVEANGSSYLALESFTEKLVLEV